MDIDRYFQSVRTDASKQRKGLELALLSVEDRITKLTDAVIEGLIDRNDYCTRKERLLHERLTLDEQKQSVDDIDRISRARADEILELGKALSSLPRLADHGEMSRIVKATTSNFSISGKELGIDWSNPFKQLVRARTGSYSGRHRDATRTSEVAHIIIEHVEKEALKDDKHVEGGA